MPRRRRWPWVLAGVVALVVGVLVVVRLTALGEPDDGRAAPPASASASASASSGATTGPDETAEPAPEAEPDPWTTVIATATGDAVDVFDEPDADAPVAAVTALAAVSLPGQVPVTFEVLERQPGWVHVVLPTEPPGSTGWVRADAVTLTTTDLAVEVRLAEHRLVVTRAGETVLDVAIGVGTDQVPPPGRYFLKELLQPPTPGGVYGSYVYGLSGYPPVLGALTAGSGVIGIHGTDDPAAVGVDGGVGCIRVLDADLTRMVQELGLPLGTPVEVVA